VARRFPAYALSLVAEDMAFEAEGRRVEVEGVMERSLGHRLVGDTSDRVASTSCSITSRSAVAAPASRAIAASARE